jgi:hypothetical protein
MHAFALALLAAAGVPGDGKAAPKAPPAAAVTVTAELACLHCTFGVGDGCAVCLKVDDKTPVMLTGKAGKELHEDRLTKKQVTVKGTLTLNKEKRLQLAGETASGKDAPAKGAARVQGVPCCGKCDLSLCDECTIAVRNGDFTIILDGKHALGHAEDATGIVTEGRLFVDQRGLVRLLATRVNLQKK